MPMKPFFLLMLFLVVTPINAVADNNEKLARIHWEKDLETTTTLIFKNHYGDIRLRSTEDQKLVFHAVGQDSKKHKIELNFDESNNQIYAEVKFSNDAQLPADHRLDAVIIVPSLLNLDIEIEHGELSSKGLKSQVIAKSVNSNISIKSAKNVDLFSQNGDVTFYAKPSKKETSHQLKSHKGDVNAYFLDKTDNQFTTIAGTDSSSNDASLLSSLVKDGRKHIFGQTKAKHQFKLQTDTGYIRIINQKHQ